MPTQENVIMMNETTFTPTNVASLWQYDQSDPALLWWWFVVLETTMLVGSVYVFASHLYYLLIRKRSGGCVVNQGGYVNKYRNILIMTVVLYAAASVAKYTLAQFIAYTKPNEGRCSAFAKANRALHITGFACLSLFFWFRQRALYGIPQLKHLASTCIVWWSWITFAIVVIAAVSGIAVVLSPFIIEYKYWIFKGRCVSSTSGLSVAALAGVISSVVVNGSLLFLFIRLIGKQLYRRKGKPASPQKEKNRSLVRRCCLLTLICVLTDIASLVVVAILKGHVPELTTVLILDMDQFLNLVCVLLCFAKWRESVFPWPCCSCLRKSDGTASSSASTSLLPGGSTTTSNIQTVAQSVNSRSITATYSKTTSLVSFTDINGSENSSSA